MRTVPHAQVLLKLILTHRKQYPEYAEHKSVVQHIFLSKTSSSAVQVSCSWLGAAVATAKDGYWMVQSQSLAGEVQRFASGNHVQHSGFCW